MASPSPSLSPSLSPSPSSPQSPFPQQQDEEQRQQEDEDLQPEKQQQQQEPQDRKDDGLEDDEEDDDEDREKPQEEQRLQQPPPPPPPSSSRRLPPPCWTHDETVALIDAYREKWYSLRRGNLKASHWQEVADSVARRCNFSPPSKTAVQCRHKIEKLRKRYRTERQRVLAGAPLPAWLYFRKMDAMETGGSGGAVGPGAGNALAVTVARPPPPVPAKNRIHSSRSYSDDVNLSAPSSSEEDDKPNTRSLHRLMSNGVGVRFRMPKVNRSPIPANSPFKPKSNSNPMMLRRHTLPKKRKSNPMAEMVSSIRLLGEGFMRVEQMKMEMAREIERMRMDMEMKRMEMILESQQRIVDSFTREFGGRKRAKRMPSPGN
ncbi:trihelix transcription factor ENAP1-like [Aristolochia californica]|uniref:trihelix transcription factor ENAP1-like n=1 Tax=Aristolochia californica TaxID=171875 RepID=UPI0035DC2499